MLLQPSLNWIKPCWGIPQESLRSNPRSKIDPTSKLEKMVARIPKRIPEKFWIDCCCVSDVTSAINLLASLTERRLLTERCVSFCVHFWRDLFHNVRVNHDREAALPSQNPFSFMNPTRSPQSKSSPTSHENLRTLRFELTIHCRDAI